MLRRWILWLLVGAFVWFVFSRLTELEHLADTLARGRWAWVAAAAALQVVYYLVVAGVYQSAFLAVGVASRARDLLAVLLASLFVNTVAPSGGMAGSALFVDEAARRGLPAARAVAAALLARILDSLGFSIWLLAGLVSLFLDHDLRAYQVAGAGVLVAVTAGAGGLLWLGLRSPHALRQLLDGFGRLVNRAMAWSGRPAPLPEGWGERHAGELAQAGRALGDRPLRVLRTVGVAVAGHLVNMLCLAALFAAFGQPVQARLLVAGYAVAILAWKTSPVPEGVGVVESVLVLVLTSVGVPAAKATVIALTFRGLGYWVPMVAGVVMLRRLRLFRPQASPTARGNHAARS
jgi:uncharacterized membrane protein YbhN (UPF0104 family)